MNILFVGNENVCRSPMAEAILKKKFEDEGIEGVVDSAGFESFMINEPPDERAVRVAKTYGYLANHNMRLFKKEDFDKFDKIYVMDTKNYMDVIDLAKTDEQKNKVDYLLNLIEPGKNTSLVNPILNGEENCHIVFKKIQDALDVLVQKAKTGELT